MADSFSYIEPRPLAAPPNRWLASCQVFLHQRLERQTLARYWDEIESVNASALTTAAMDLQQLQAALVPYRKLARAGRLVADRPRLHEALVLLRALSELALGMRPYDVQLLCALALLDCQLVQLAPGEGKTLTLAIVAVIFAWSGRPCHVVTANDYLAARDAELMQPLFDACGLKVAAVGPDTDAEEKPVAYGCDLVYSTSKQLLADYLQDIIAAGGPVSRLSLSMDQLRGKQGSSMMRGLYAAIIDEADSILIDDATTPLIISGPQPDPVLEAGVRLARDIVDRMQPGHHYQFIEAFREVKFTREGEALLEAETPRLPPLWRHPDRRYDLLQQAVVARDYFIRDRHYVVVDDQVVIVDESTGRMMPGRTWSYGLHQAIEARAGVPLTPPNNTLAKMSFQNFFKLYHRLCGASGTLQNIEAEIYANYRIHTLRVPSRLPSRLLVKPFRHYPTQTRKWQAVAALVREKHQQGLPLLLGTRSITDSERLADLLAADGFDFALLNAKNHENEAMIVAAAGQAGRITVATNMAGRGTDIKVPAEVLEQGGLVVVMLEPHESARIDWQLFGRAGRQGNPGEVVPMVAADDELLSKHLPWWLSPLRRLWAAGYSHGWLAGLAISRAQRQAELKAFRQRQQLNRQDRKAREMMSFIRNY
ncbi:MAG: hypothetical protein LAT63_17190 [Marinobacter sp.]|nr:hypothetical protein [Marinobacter sp.]